MKPLELLVQKDPPFRKPGPPKRKEPKKRKPDRRRPEVSALAPLGQERKKPYFEKSPGEPSYFI